MQLQKKKKKVWICSRTEMKSIQELENSHCSAPALLQGISLESKSGPEVHVLCEICDLNLWASTFSCSEIVFIYFSVCLNFIVYTAVSPFSTNSRFCKNLPQGQCQWRPEGCPLASYQVEWTERKNETGALLKETGPRHLLKGEILDRVRSGQKAFDFLLAALFMHCV